MCDRGTGKQLIDPPQDSNSITMFIYGLGAGVHCLHRAFLDDPVAPLRGPPCRARLDLVITVASPCSNRQPATVGVGVVVNWVLKNEPNPESEWISLIFRSFLQDAPCRALITCVGIALRIFYAY